jgi:hypothetical protein
MLKLRGEGGISPHILYFFGPLYMSHKRITRDPPFSKTATCYPNQTVGNMSVHKSAQVQFREKRELAGREGCTIK